MSTKHKQEANLVIFGIDPGKKGGWARIKDPHLTGSFDKPEDRSVHLLTEDLGNLQSSLNYWTERAKMVTVLIEDQWPRPGAAARSSRTLMLNFGRLVRSVEIAGADMVLVHPTFWKRDMGVTKDKGVCIQEAERLWPEVNLIPPGKRVRHDGMAEAILLVEWLRMLLGTGGR